MIRAHPSVAHERVVAPGLAQRMTCSDKIAKWNALGLQVCITVQVPVYVNHHFDISAVGSRVHCCQGGSSHCSCRQQRLGASSLDHTVSVLCVADCRTSCQAQCRNLQGHSGASDIRHSCARKSSWTPERSVQQRGGGRDFRTKPASPGAEETLQQSLLTAARASLCLMALAACRASASAASYKLSGLFRVLPLRSIRQKGWKYSGTRRAACRHKV